MRWLYILALGLLMAACGYLLIALSQAPKDYAVSACEAALNDPALKQLREAL